MCWRTSFICETADRTIETWERWKQKYIYQKKLNLYAWSLFSSELISIVYYSNSNIILRSSAGLMKNASFRIFFKFPSLFFQQFLFEIFFFGYSTATFEIVLIVAIQAVEKIEHLSLSKFKGNEVLSFYTKQKKSKRTHSKIIEFNLLFYKK
jgi:hypothetical protein